MKTYLAICFGYWSRGATEEEALAQLYKAGGRKRDATVTYVVEHSPTEDKPYVDNYGNICYYGSNTKLAEYVEGKRQPIQGTQTNEHEGLSTAEVPETNSPSTT